MRKKILLALIIILLVVWVCFSLFNVGLDKLQNITLKKQDLSTKENGFYHGECNIGRWRNRVQLRVYEGKIVDLKVVKDQIIVSKETRDEIIKRVMEQQQVPVDAVAGATVTSNAYLKAIEEALKAGPRLPQKF